MPRLPRALLRSVFAGPVVVTIGWAQTPAAQTEADAYTRYELLAPGSAKFRIVYEVTATTPGATAYFNPIRPGSVASDERVTDRATGRPLAFERAFGRPANAVVLPPGWVLTAARRPPR